MAQPFSGSNATILRIKRSRVPWTRSDGLLKSVPPSVTDIRVTQLLSVIKGEMSAAIECAAADLMDGNGFGGTLLGQSQGESRTRAVSVYPDVAAVIEQRLPGQGQ